MRRSLDELLADARARIERLTPAEALAAVEEGALIVDIRSDLDRRIVVLCDHGCASILAAATLVELGFACAADVAGGFEAWQAAGIPVAPAPARPEPPALAGVEPPR